MALLLYIYILLFRKNINFNVVTDIVTTEQEK